MHDETLPETLQSETQPGRAGVVGMSDGRFIVVFEARARDEEHEGGSVLRPGQVGFGKQTKERRPMLCIAAGIKRAPLLGVERRRRPARGLEEPH